MIATTDRAINYLSQHISELPNIAERNTRAANQASLPERSAVGRLRKCIDEFLSQKEKKWYIMPGLRGTGKTTILYQIYNYLKRKGSTALYLSCDELHINGFTLHEILGVYEEKFLPTRISSLDTPLFLLVDEVHFDKDWSLALKVLYDKASKIFIIATGSSSLAIQAPDATRRTLKIDILPMTFQEYIMLKYGVHAKYRTAENIRKALFLSNTPKKACTLAENIYKNLRNDYFSKFDVEKEIAYYLRTGGFPYVLQIKNEKEMYENIHRTVERVIRDDLPQISGISRDTLSYVMSILYQIANYPGRVSYQSIADAHRGLKVKDVYNIIHGLQAAEVIFSLRPMGSIAKVGKGGLTHYLSSSTLRATLLYKHGLLKHTSDVYGLLLENAVAAHLNKNKVFTPEVQEVTFDPRDGGANFVVTTPNSRIVVECGWKKESIKQVNFTLNEIKETVRDAYGIIVTTEKSCKVVNDVVVIPKELFLLS